MSAKVLNRAVLVVFAAFLMLVMSIPFTSLAQNTECRDGILYMGTTQVGTCTPGQAPPSPANNALLRDGIFGCNASKYANIGTLSAVGGVYVPVNDAAVTLNTGYLVYKECILDGVVSKISEAARTDLAGTIMRQLTTAREGQALYVRNFWEERAVVTDKATLTIADPENTSAICEAFKQPTVTTEVRRYLAARNAPQQAYACSFPGAAGDHDAALKGQASSKNVLEALGGLAMPGNDPLSAYLLYHDAAASARAAAVYAQEKQWDWGNGFYSVTNNSDNPFAEEIYTPSYLVAQGAEQAVTSGFRCLEGADELSEVCAPMFAGLSTQIISDARGLTGLSQPASGIPSYVSRMASEAGAAVRQEAVNAALSILATARQVEAAFRQAKAGIVNVLINSINRLKAAENACWALIIEKTCSSPPNAQRDCPAVGGGTLRVATSTEFSQAVINSQISPVATIAAEDLQNSEKALAQLDQLIAAVTNNSSATGQRQALEQLDQLVANGILHTASQAQSANKQLEDVTGSATTLIEDTLRAWGDDLNPNVGWCNVNNQPVIDLWTSRWKQ